MRPLRSLLLLALVLGQTIAVAASPAQAGRRGRELPIPTANSFPIGIAAGPDGNLWFTETANKIGRVTTSGVFTEFSIPTPGSYPYGIAAGPDGEPMVHGELRQPDRIRLPRSEPRGPLTQGK